MNNSIKKILKNSGYPERALYEWETFSQAYQQEFGEALPDESQVNDLALLFGQSFYLCNRLQRTPSLARDFFSSRHLSTAKSRETFLVELVNAVEPVRDDSALLADKLRDYRYAETLRMTVREIKGLDSYDNLGRERSDLAAACIELAYQVVHEGLLREYGAPQDPAGPAAFSVLGMGKLGGGDLNYSSDVDLIYFYSMDGESFSSAPHEHHQTHHQYYVKLGEQLTRLLSDRTANGFVYRVDLDLRPEGTKGTLANSLEAMEHYYEIFGDNWERMALTKALPVGGSVELGETFLSRVKSFVYPRVTDFSTLEQIKDLKQRIEQSLTDKMTGSSDPQSPGYNVKLGHGGIREVEFFVGAFQRLYGGQHPELQDRHTLTVLQHLISLKMIRQEDGLGLEHAYQFLRTVENRLQMLEERQTHSLPKTKDDLQSLAKNLFSEIESPAAALDKLYEQLFVHTSFIRNAFEKLLET